MLRKTSIRTTTCATRPMRRWPVNESRCPASATTASRESNGFGGWIEARRLDGARRARRGHTQERSVTRCSSARSGLGCVGRGGPPCRLEVTELPTPEGAGKTPTAARARFESTTPPGSLPRSRFGEPASLAARAPGLQERRPTKSSWCATYVSVPRASCCRRVASQLASWA